MKREIALLGPFPPPRGGVSVHLLRLRRRLEADGIPARVYAENRPEPGTADELPDEEIKDFKTWFLRYWFLGKERVFHCHSHSWNRRFFVALLRLRGHRVVFSFHSLRDRLQDFAWTKKLRIRLLLALASKLIVVHDTLAEKLASWGAAPAKIEVIDAFIPPSPDESGPLSASIENFLQKGDKIILTNAGKPAQFEGRDLYGIDTVLHLTGQLKSHHENLKTIVCLGDAGDGSYVRRLEALVKELGLQDDVKIVVGENLVTLLPRADLFIRASLSDGASVSLLEALALGVPVLAGDVCPRPTGTVTFRSGDPADLRRRALGLLATAHDGPPAGGRGRADASYDALKRVYAEYGITPGETR